MGEEEDGKDEHAEKIRIDDGGRGAWEQKKRRKRRKAEGRKRKREEEQERGSYSWRATASILAGALLKNTVFAARPSDAKSEPDSA